MFFIGFIVSCLIIPPLSDSKGRKGLIIFSCFAQAICCLVFIFVPNMTLYFVAVTVIGLTIPMRTMVGYSHLLEFMPTKVSLLSTLCFFMDGMVMVVSPIILNFFTNNTMLFIWIALGINAAAILSFVIFYLPESSKFLLEKGVYERASKDI